MQRRRRRGGRGRIPNPVYIGRRSPAESFTPHPTGDDAPILLEHAELEAFRLVDLEGLSQEEAGERMGVSRGTVWRLLQAARKKTAQALSEGRRIQISPGET
jgi:hypothetical protein